MAICYGDLSHQHQWYLFEAIYCTQYLWLVFILDNFIWHVFIHYGMDNITNSIIMDMRSTNEIFWSDILDMKMCAIRWCTWHVQMDRNIYGKIWHEILLQMSWYCHISLLCIVFGCFASSKSIIIQLQMLVCLKWPITE